MLTAQECSHCGRNNSGNTPIEGDASPEPGDVSLCAYCALFSVFTDELTLRRPNADETRWIRASPLCRRAQMALVFGHRMLVGG